jgi:hypothetical protein
MNIDKATAKALSDECALALQAVAAEHDLELVPKGGNFGPSELNMRFQLRSTETDDDGNRITRESENFKRLASTYGLSPDDLGREFGSSRGRYKITGLVPRRPKYPIQATCLRTGKSFKFRVADVLRAFLIDENK